MIPTQYTQLLLRFTQISAVTSKCINTYDPSQKRPYIIREDAEAEKIGKFKFISMMFKSSRNNDEILFKNPNVLSLESQKRFYRVPKLDIKGDNEEYEKFDRFIDIQFDHKEYQNKHFGNEMDLDQPKVEKIYNLNSKATKGIVLFTFATASSMLFYFLHNSVEESEIQPVVERRGDLISLDEEKLIRCVIKYIRNATEATEEPIKNVITLRPPCKEQSLVKCEKCSSSQDLIVEMDPSQSKDHEKIERILEETCENLPIFEPEPILPAYLSIEYNV